MSFTIPTNVVTVQPTVEPVGVDDVKVNSYVIDDETEHKFIREDLIPTARRYVEELAKRSLITQTRTQSYDYMPCSPVLLRYGPVQQVNSVAYTDTNEAAQTLASTYYNVDAVRNPGRLLVAYGQTWPTAFNKANSVVITYVAGFGATGKSVPNIYRRAIIVLCTHWYQNRDQFGCVDDDMVSKLENMLAIEGRTLEYA